MKTRRLALFCIMLLAMMFLLCACGDKAADETVADHVVQTAAPTAEPVEPAEDTEEATIAELYEETTVEGVFKLNNISTDSYSVDGAFLHDGCVLLLMKDYSEEGYENEIGVQHIMNSGKMVLFPLNRPDAAVIRDMERFEANYKLFEGGKVLETSWDGSYRVYNSDLEEIYKESGNCGTFLGASEQGDIWYLTEDASFVLHRDGKQTRSEPVEGMMHGSYIGTVDGKAYFTMYNTYYGWTCSSVDLQSMVYTESRVPSDSYDAHNGLISYTSEDKWYIADCADPFTVTAFSKPYSNEGIWDMDDRYLIGSAVDYDAITDSFSYGYHVYNIQNGGICAQISAEAFPGGNLFVLDYEQGVALLEAHDENLVTTGLYLWDMGELDAPEPADIYETMDYHVDEDCVEELIQQINDQYGVTVYYDAEHLAEYTSGYELLECSDTDRIGYMLIHLQECMAEYPEGFFQEIKGESINNVVFCLCDAHNRIDETTIEDAAATVNTIDDTLVMTIDVHCWRELRRIFLHENTHMMETRLAEEMPKVSSRNYVEYWYTEMNLPSCPPIQQYIWEQDEETLKGVYDVDPENACYIDWYSKCTINEDHARIMENGIYSGSARYFTAPYIDRKSRFLNAMIREAFPCVRNSGEVFWEQRTGVVDLHQEFSDFADR